MIERDEVWYLDIDGVLNRYAFTEDQMEECVQYLNQSLSDLKLNTPSIEEIKKMSKTSTVKLVFNLPYLLSKYSINYVLSMNDCYLDEKKFTWYLKTEEVGSQYGYTITIPNQNSNLYKQYSLKHDFSKQFKSVYYMDAWREEAVQALNSIYQKYRPQKIVIISGWRNQMSKLKDWMQMYHLEIPIDIIEGLIQSDTNRGLSIMEDLKLRGYPKNYKVIDDEYQPSYVAFGSHLIKCDKFVGLTMEEIKEKEKVKVYGN